MSARKTANEPAKLQAALVKLNLWPKPGESVPLPDAEMRRQIGTMVREMDGEVLAGAFYSMLMLTAGRLEKRRRG